MRYRGTEARLTNVSTSRRRPNTSSVLGASWGSCCTNRAGKLRSATCHKPALYSLKIPSFCLRHGHFSHTDIQKKTVWATDSYSATTTWNTLLCQTPASSIKCHRNLAQISDTKISVLTEIHQSLTKAQPHAFVFFSLHKNDPC